MKTLDRISVQLDPETLTVLLDVAVAHHCSVADVAQVVLSLVKDGTPLMDEIERRLRGDS